MAESMRSCLTKSIAKNGPTKKREQRLSKLSINTIRKWISMTVLVPPRVLSILQELEYKSQSRHVIDRDSFLADLG